MRENAMYQCRVCENNTNNTRYTAKEMMYGLRDEFEYFQCGECQCLQIKEFPSDLSKYYPSRYYSFSVFDEKRYKGVEGLIKKLKFSSIVFKETILQKAIYRLFHRKHIFGELNIFRQSSVLDVGSGNGGKFLYPLAAIGIKHVLGCDPFLAESIRYENGLEVLKSDIFNIDGAWDLIAFNHSFEHVDNPVETIQKVSTLLSPEGVCMVRIPTVSSYAWEHYRTDWFQLDAPRHFFLHSQKSMELIAKKAGLEIFKVVYDSTYKQFEESEKYKNNISLRAPRPKGIRNFWKRKARKITYRKLARQMNLQQTGDQAAFFLRKARGLPDFHSQRLTFFL